MFKNEAELNLREKYNFDVTLRLEQHGYTGELELTPQKCKLKILGESRPNTTLTIGESRMDILTCESFRQYFILYGLELTAIKNKHIPQPIGSISFFECTYSIEFVVCCEHDIVNKLPIDNVSIFSNELGPWVGLTKNRNNLIKNYVCNKQHSHSYENTTEFECDIDSGKKLLVKYDTKYHGYDATGYSVGMSYIPCVTVEFDNPQTPLDVFNEYQSIYFLLSFFIGKDLNVEKIVFGYNLNYYQQGFIYFPNAILSAKDTSDTTFFPLGHDLLFNDFGLPAIPEEAFSNYYQLQDVKRNYFNKYRIYSRMDNLEERYLGYFRLLEQLCFKKKNYLDENILSGILDRSKNYLHKVFNDKKNVDAFLRSIKRSNGFKYNTEKCISDFHKELPTEIKDILTLNQSDITEFCKLRNDITHANYYSISDDKLYAYVKAIEILLLIALCRTLNIKYEDISSVLSRVGGIHTLRYFHETRSFK